MSAIPRRSVSRLALSLSAGAVVALAAASRAPWRLAALAGWDAGGLLLLLLAWTIIDRSDAKETQATAAVEDPGRALITLLVVLASTASLFGATALVRRAKTSPGPEGDALVALCLATVALSWALTHTAFTLRYAHLYYREDEEGVGGIELPGGAPPRYSDFAYFAFTVGMCFQVSDATVSSAQIRSTVLQHSVLSFVYNTVILAFVLNLVFSLASN